MPKKNFGSGTIVEPAWFNAIQQIIFDGQDLDGHYPRLTDDALSDDQNQIKARVRGVVDEFKVTLQSGLYVKVNQGFYKSAAQEVFDLGETVLLCADNAVNYIFISASNQVEISQFHPAGTLLLAVVATSSGLINSISDRRARFVQPAGITPETGDFGDAIATLAWVKQLLLVYGFGLNVPNFTANPQSLEWGNGEARFDGVAHPITSGIFAFTQANTGWYYVYAQDEGATAIIVVSLVPPDLATQQLWWNMYVSGGNIQQFIPARPGFGV
ncbi:MAG TPA: hypothetical protein V6D27_01130 [Vampirovibrionales bacterium]